MPWPVSLSTRRVLPHWKPSILNAPGMAARFTFQPGQVQLIDNRALGHKRTGFRDWPDPERKRLLIRLWLRDRGSRAYNG